MMREYATGDELKLKPNQFSSLDMIEHLFDDGDYWKYTQEDGENIEAILLFKEYEQGCYQAMVLISEDYAIDLARELKKFMYDAIVKLGAVRVHTDSIDCEILTKWHKFLGFELEGIRRKLLGGKDYAMWAIVRGQTWDSK